MDFEEILNALEDLVENSWTLPMSGGRTVVDLSLIHISAPRERASNPSCPLPANKSSTVLPSISN